MFSLRSPAFDAVARLTCGRFHDSLEFRKRNRVMPAEIVELVDGIVTLNISGKLTQAELGAAQQALSDIIREQGKVRILARAEQFAGWERDKWDDFSFQAEHDDDIEKIAIVGEEKWKQLTLVFTAQGLRKFPIRYFATPELDKARGWLSV
jgi:hypothetical protein